MNSSRILTLKASLNIEDEIRRRGVDLRYVTSSSRLEGCCPFHDDRRPSFNVYLQTQRYHCFGCGADGDVLDFICAYDGRNLHDVLQSLEGRGAPYRQAIEPQAQTQRARVPSTKQSKEEASLQDHTSILTRASVIYHALLLRTPRAISYLEARGITARGMRLCRLGYADGQALRRALSGNKQWRQQAHQAGLLTASGKEWFSGRIIIPDLSPDGTCFWMIGRTLPGANIFRFRADDKYLGLPIPKTLFGYRIGLSLLEERGSSLQGLLLLEGALDYVLAREWELPVIPLALIGTYASRGQLEGVYHLREKSGLPVIDWHDADEQGRTASLHLLDQLRGEPTLLFPEIASVNDLGELGVLPFGYARMKQAWHAMSEGGEW